MCHNKSHSKINFVLLQNILFLQQKCISTETKVIHTGRCWRTVGGIEQNSSKTSSWKSKGQTQQVPTVNNSQVTLRAKVKQGWVCSVFDGWPLRYWRQPKTCVPDEEMLRRQQRSSHAESTNSLKVTEVYHQWAWSVLSWVATK